MPTHVFRVWSHQSNGTNTPTLFGPASTSPTAPDPSQKSMAEQLKMCFHGKPAPANPFINFTSSLLFALQLAAYMKALWSHDNIMITCIDLTTARTSAGEQVTLHTAADMLAKYGVELHNRSDNSVRDYEGVYFLPSAQASALGRAHGMWRTRL